MLDLLDRHIPVGLDPLAHLKARFLVATLALAVLAGACAFVPSVVLGDQPMEPIHAAGFVGTLVLAVGGYLLLWRVSLAAAVGWFLLGAFAITNGLAMYTGGVTSPAFHANAAVLLFASMLGRPAQALGLMGLVIGAGTAMWVQHDLLTTMALTPTRPLDVFLASVFVFVLVAVVVLAMALLQENVFRASVARADELERAQQRLEQTTVSTNYMRSVLGAARDMIIVVDEDLRIVDLNPAVTELLGYTRVELLGRSLGDLGSFVGTDPRDGVPVTATIARVDGRRLPVTVSRGRLESVVAGGALTGFVYALSDTTVQQAAVEAVRRAHGQAEAANQAKSRFLANMSHELRTPLNAIIGYSELLDEEITDAGQRGDLQRVRGAARHLLQLINGILDLSKVEAGKTRLDVREVMLQPLVHDAVETVRPNLRPGVELLLDATDLGTARLDETKTRQILLNLLSNAVKFTASGQVGLRAERWDREGMPWLRFVVTDSGIGMTEAQLTSIFEPFSQADAATERRYGGTGLGLSISQAFSRMMGGEIYVESTMGEGSIFTVELPIGELEQLRTPGAVPRHAMPEREGSAQLVLCIDDDRSALELLSRLLAGERRQVVGTPDPEQGIVWARALRPDLVTVDVQMPRMSGWNVLARMRDDDVLRDIPTVVITAEGEEQVARALGAVAILHKPVQRDALDALVATLLDPRDPLARRD